MFCQWSHMDGLDKGSKDNQITIRGNMLIEDFLINPNKSERIFFQKRSLFLHKPDQSILIITLNSIKQVEESKYWLCPNGPLLSCFPFQCSDLTQKTKSFIMKRRSFAWSTSLHRGLGKWVWRRKNLKLVLIQRPSLLRENFAQFYFVHWLINWLFYAVSSVFQPVFV